MNSKIDDLENTKIFNEAAYQALKAVFAINGAAAIAMLAFLGNVATADFTGINLQILVCSLQLFSCGVGVSALAYGLNYLNISAFRHKYPLWGKFCFFGSFVAGFVSLLLFFSGVWTVSELATS